MFAGYGITATSLTRDREVETNTSNCNHVNIEHDLNIATMWSIFIESLTAVTAQYLTWFPAPSYLRHLPCACPHSHNSNGQTSANRMFKIVQKQAKCKCYLVATKTIKWLHWAELSIFDLIYAFLGWNLQQLETRPNVI